MNHFHNHSNDLSELIGSIPTYEEALDIADILSVLSDPTRIRILWLLCHTEECVTDIALAIGMSAPAISHHLKLLKQNKILESKKIGKETLYTLAKNKHAELIHNMIDDMFDTVCNKKKEH